MIDQPISLSLRLTKLQRVALLVGTIVIVAYYAASIIDQWRPTPDSAQYLLLAKSLATGQGYTIGGRPHLHVPPGFPALLAVMAKLGIGSWLAYNILITTIALLCVAVTYMLCREVCQSFGSLVPAVAATIALGLNGHLHRQALFVLSDLPFALCVLIGLYCYQRGTSQSNRGSPGCCGCTYYLEIGTLAFLASCTMRMVGFPLVIGAAVGLMLQPTATTKGRKFANAFGLLIGIAVLAGVYYFYHHTYSSNIAPSYRHHFSRMGERHLMSWLTQPFDNLNSTRKQFMELIVFYRPDKTIVAVLLFWVPFITGIVAAIRRKRWVIILTPAFYLGAILALRSPIIRYYIPIVPIVLLLWFIGIEQLVRSIKPIRSFSGEVVAITLISVAIINLTPGIPGAMWHDNIHLNERDRQRWFDALPTADKMRQIAQADDLFVSEEEWYPLALLSDIDLLPLHRSLRRTLDDTTFENILRDHDVTLLVTKSAGRQTIDEPTMYDRVGASLVERGMGEAVWQNGEFVIYRIEW